jgi:hypothetical protein
MYTPVHRYIGNRHRSTVIAVDKFVKTGKGLKPLVPESLNVLTALARACHQLE